MEIHRAILEQRFGVGEPIESLAENPARRRHIYKVSPRRL